MSDIQTILDAAIDKALEEIADAEEEAIIDWCAKLNCTPVELAEYYQIGTSMSTTTTEQGVKMKFEFWLELKR